MRAEASAQKRTLGITKARINRKTTCITTCGFKKNKKNLKGAFPFDSLHISFVSEHDGIPTMC